MWGGGIHYKILAAMKDRSGGVQDVTALKVFRNKGRLTSSMCSSCCSRSSFLDVVVMRPAKRYKFIDPNKTPSLTPCLVILFINHGNSLHFLALILETLGHGQNYYEKGKAGIYCIFWS